MSNQKDADPSGDMLWMIAVIVGIVLLIVFFFGNGIATVYLTFKLWQLKLITMLYPGEEFMEMIKAIEGRTVKSWTFKEINYVGGKIGYIINIPMVILVGWLSYKVYDKNPLAKYKRVLNMNSLKRSEQRIWPYIAPVVEGDLIKESFTEGPYAMGMKPYDFAKHYKILSDERNVNSLEKSKAEKLFASQLARLWPGVSRLKKHEKALLAIMAAHGCGDKKGAMAAVNAIAISSAKVGLKKMPDFSSAKDLYKYLDDERVKAVIDRHAYVYTIVAQMMEFARTTGVFPSSYFVWLKPRDRVMFYVINCIGRQVAFVEVAGIIAHWKAEQVATHKLEAPFVIKAVEGLEHSLAEVKLI